MIAIATNATPAMPTAMTVQRFLDMRDVSSRSSGMGFPRRGKRSSGLERLDETDLVGEHHDLDAIAQVELGQDPTDVGLHGRLGEHELLGDLRVGETAC